MRSDGARNRELLLQSAGRLFAKVGPSVPLEDVAADAGVSRTTLYRNFSTREELAASVFEENVRLIEARSRELLGDPAGVIKLLDFVLDMQTRNRGFILVLAGAEISWFTALSDRTANAFSPLVARAHEAGVVHPEVGVEDFMVAFPMAEGVLNDREPSSGRDSRSRMHRLLHRALFTEAQPTEP